MMVKAHVTLNTFLFGKKIPDILDVQLTFCKILRESMEFLIFLGTYCVTIAFQSSNVTDLSLILVSFPCILRHVPSA